MQTPCPISRCSLRLSLPPPPFFLALALIVDGAADVIKNGKPCWGRLAGAAACLSGGLLALLLATAF